MVGGFGWIISWIAAHDKKQNSRKTNQKKGNKKSPNKPKTSWDVWAQKREWFLQLWEDWGREKFEQLEKEGISIPANLVEVFKEKLSDTMRWVDSINEWSLDNVEDIQSEFMNELLQILAYWRKNNHQKSDLLKTVEKERLIIFWNNAWKDEFMRIIDSGQTVWRTFIKVFHEYLWLEEVYDTQSINKLKWRLVSLLWIKGISTENILTWLWYSIKEIRLIEKKGLSSLNDKRSQNRPM